MKKLTDEDNYIKCKNSALRVIERTYKSEKELRDKLALKGYEDHIIKRTINFLREYNLLNDINYAKMYVKDRSRNQGKKKIKYTLMQKGIDENIIEEELEKLNKDEIKEVVHEMALKIYTISVIVYIHHFLFYLKPCISLMSSHVQLLLCYMFICNNIRYY